MYNEDKIINTLSLIQDTCFGDLNSVERLLVISNLLLVESEYHLPSEVKQDAQNLLSNGKRVHYEFLKFDDNLGLKLAIKAHEVIAEVNKEIENNE